MRGGDVSTHISIQSIRACTKCDSSAVFCESTLDDAPRYFVLCNDCDFEGGEAMNAQAAIDLWNNPQTIKPVRRYKEF
ncbi:hypothetical protein VCRA2113O324_160076 [Vibrio crassostreae]|nr:hypothetical protein VCRA2111O320_160076 [Vibrio crassostreae]CAK1795908.1 hypothetical protein VCRA2113O324_160076 [Vibrio crassostreae]CAK1799273.1 hypothetical protein VCRA2114E123_160077 [Vibrio crassostreae]CAK1812430.1 hypothetical protein VCRA2114E122_170077 [Vibrio crassostreae]CAK2287431.1 hypothetical protein VCRA2112O114_190044 [Vibrio crassostreae]